MCLLPPLSSCCVQGSTESSLPLSHGAPAAHTEEVTVPKNLQNCINNPYFSKRGEPGSAREAGGEATEAMAASVRVNRKDD